jgi:hypothetical protein
MPKIISQSFRRHTNKSESGNATKYGIKQSEKLGENLPKNEIFKGYTGDIKENRLIKTLESIEKGFIKKKGVVITGKNPARKIFGESVLVRDKKKAYELYKKINSDGHKLMELWFHGKISKNILLTPNELADVIIKSRVGHVLRFIKSKSYKNEIENLPKIHLENITQNFMVGSLFQRLSGKNFIDYVPTLKIHPRENVNLNYYRDKNGDITIIMQFRKYSFDVTKKMNEIINA